jgi:hypothetical protein
MLQPKGIATGGKGFRVLFIPLLAIAAAILWIAQPVVANAERVTIVLADGKKMELEYDASMVNVLATVDGKNWKVGDKKSYPVVLGHNTQKIVGIYPGPVPVVIFEGNSNCYLINGRWIGYPAGTVCP